MDARRILRVVTRFFSGSSGNSIAGTRGDRSRPGGLPEALLGTALVPGYETARFWGDVYTQAFEDTFTEKCAQVRALTEVKRMYFYKMIDSPIGKLKLVASDKGLAGILWEKEDPRRVRLTPMVEDASNPFIRETEHQLAAYFNGERDTFDVPLDFKGTEFQKKVWAALLAIPYGETRSYGEIARRIGHPSASRAVGAANGKNPIAIIAPCHRVIGSTGKLTGFAGGLAVKEHLLRLERGASASARATGSLPQRDAEAA